jgi:DNA-binding NarL/FixJ family response regulator
MVGNDGTVEDQTPVPATPRPRVLIADDHASVLAGLVKLLEADFEVVAAVGNGHLLVEAAARLRPDVIVTDLAMPGLNGIEALERLKEAGSQAKVIILTMHTDPEVVAQTIRSGALGFVVKLTAAQELVKAVTEVSQGRRYLPSG